MDLLASLRSNTVGISIFAVITAGLIAVTQVSTQERISANERAQQAKALYEVVPAQMIDNDLFKDVITLAAPELGYNQAIIHQAQHNDQVTAVIIPVIAPDGYSGDISLIVGINANSSLSGVRVLSHKETPGLGDKIDLKKSDWILSFNQKMMKGDNDPTWAVKKEGGQFDQFTGATITPRAVINAVGKAVLFFKQHKTQLLTIKPSVEAP